MSKPRRALHFLRPLLCLLLISSSLFTSPSVFAHRQIYTDLFNLGATPPTQSQKTVSVANLSGSFILTLQNGATNGGQRISSGSVELNGTVILGPTQLTSQAGALQVAVTLQASNTLKVTLNSGASNAFVIISLLQHLTDTTPPTLTLTQPSSGQVFTTSPITVSGAATDNLSGIKDLWVNGVLTPLVNGAFTTSLSLTTASTRVSLYAKDYEGNLGTTYTDVFLDSVPPTINIQSPADGAIVTTSTLSVSAVAYDDVGFPSVTLNGQPAVRDGDLVSATVTLTPGANTITLIATDGVGRQTTVTRTVTYDAGPQPPPDPATVAPPVDATVASILSETTKFLYSGSSPIQTGVAQGAIQPLRAAVLRGKVLNRDNTPLSGVKITVFNHPELGQTLSRTDGMFDLAVNGGGLVTLNYEKTGYLPVQRQTNTPWQDYVVLDDVVMIPLDSQVTPINLSATTPIQVAQGSPVTDSSGMRRATLLFSQGTTATTAGGTVLTNLNIRATEYTVGANGPKTMPGPLPPSSGYTYAVELTADEALGQSITFSKPVYTYVENFLNFPIGGIVPVGYYDRTKAAWIPSANGKVIKILSITAGMADLDTNGDGLPDDAATLTALGVTDAERQKLATLYLPNQSLWRVPITHFSPWDCNWPYGPPPDARAPQSKLKKIKEDCPDKKQGSIIECQNQTLGERVAITAIPYTLNYRSDRVPGRKTEYSLDIPLSGASIPGSLKRIDLEIEVAGRQFTQSFTAAPNQKYSFTWDGKDAYGRTLQGDQPALVRIGYVYDAVYQSPAQLVQSFAAFSGIPITVSRARQEITLWQASQSTLGVWNGARRSGIGGWSLDNHHAYDPTGRVLYLGSGERRSAITSSIITTVAGNGTGVFSGDDGPAVQAGLASSVAVAVAADGSVYIA
ncbi:MAG: hypothetical protein HY028_05585, partial [Gammaproteobacteria bacterium]|nr:hypothetical protein [Gammaproteobacteria bacterium]